MNINELVNTAVACYEAGADGIHAHVRDGGGRHVLDSGLYRELIDELQQQEPDMLVQITSEAMGRYSPAEQRALVADVSPRSVSVALREMTSDDDDIAQRKFYFDAFEAGIEVQHILYDPQELLKLARLVAGGVVPHQELSMLFVLGSYSGNQTDPAEVLKSFLGGLKNWKLKNSPKFMVCAFGQNEHTHLLNAAKCCADCRVGFENNHLLPDGSLAESNAAQVSALVAALGGKA